MKVYLDKCCYSRPFDDQSRKHIHFETKAIAAIFDSYRAKGWTLISSEVLDWETDRDPNTERRAAVRLYSKLAQEYIEVVDTVVARGKQLEAIGFDTHDALHIASAEAAEADVLLTTDNKVMRLARKHASQLKVRVENPTTWIRRELNI